jgi:PTS system cellobiose-specific IIB component
MKIILVCSAGMSTSMLVKKMKDSATERNIDIEVKALAESQLKNNLEGVDVVLIGPQVRYLEKKIKQQVESLGIKVDIINQLAYGMMQGDKVVDQAIALKG